MIGRTLPGSVALGLVLVVALLVGCRGDVPDGARADGSDPLVRDSAGIRIVENPGSVESRWRVAEPPLFTVGWEAGGPMFTWVPAGAILPDGGAVVGENSESTLYRLDPAGGVLGTWGGRGEGPGEFDRFGAIFLSADSIIVSDNFMARSTSFSLDGELLGTRRVSVEPMHRASSVLPSGKLLYVGSDGYGPAPDVRPEWLFEPVPVLAVGVEGAGVDTLANLPHRKRWLGERGGPAGALGVIGRVEGTPDGFAWARSDLSEVHWFDESGALIQIARWAEPEVEVSPEYVSRMVRVSEEGMRDAGAPEEIIASQLAGLDVQLARREGGVPYWNRFETDRLGNVWLGEYPMPTQFPERYRVITRDGTYMGWVDLPDVVSILDITDDRVLAVRFDENDVPAVVMFELIKS